DMTRRWREKDSNPRSPARGTALFETALREWREDHAGFTCRGGLAGGGRRIRTLGPPQEGQRYSRLPLSIFSAPSRRVRRMKRVDASRRSSLGGFEQGVSLMGGGPRVRILLPPAGRRVRTWCWGRP